uniref:TrkH family potassium uptake protein n=1 Tax=Eubacterium cellulosolvens TaxID=29322 RepID=UPI00048364DF|nr:potassium transporter TrkG [[Eubacterium] cellulosolvens]
MEEINNRIRHLKPVQIIILGFALAIISGTLLLMLPVAKKGAGSAGFADALFTAVSSTCVTGLVVQDTATYWSAFGQAVILLMIQIGGLGVITVAISIAIVSGRKIGLLQRNIMQASISAPQISGIVKFTRFILLATFGCELAGAVGMLPVFAGMYGIRKGCWYAVFHSVSAFCNAGFDLMGGSGRFSSLTSLSVHPVINVTIMALIILGGIGFFTWMDVVVHGIHFSRYRMQSKVSITVSVILILIPALFFYFCEFGNLETGRRIWYSLFQAVTPRTAGFNTADLTKLGDNGIFLMIILMLIGGSPASTAGGMKTTTVAVLFASAFSVFQRKKDAGLFGRRISTDSITNAGAILLLYAGLFAVCGMCISAIEKLPLLTCLFETASAIGTVGLTLGITPSLSLVSRTILVILMYVGRVGGLTLIFAAVSEKGLHKGRLPEESITVG